MDGLLRIKSDDCISNALDLRETAIWMRSDTVTQANCNKTGSEGWINGPVAECGRWSEFASMHRERHE